MLRKLPESSGAVLGYEVTDEVTQQDVAEMQADIEGSLADHDEVRLVIRVDGLDRVEPAAVWQDLRMLQDYIRSVERVAVIGDERWHELASKAGEVVAETETFPPTEADRAWTWARG